MKIAYVHTFIFTVYTNPWIILLISAVLCETFSNSFLEACIYNGL